MLRASCVKDHGLLGAPFARPLLIGERTRPGEHGVDHRRRELPCESVLLARVIAAEQRPALSCPFASMAEARAWARRRGPGKGMEPQGGVPGEGPQADNDAEVLEQRELGGRPREAAIELGRRRAVCRWCAAHRGRDETASEPLAVVTGDRRRLRGEARTMERCEQEVAGTVAGENAARAITPVRCRREPEQEYPRLRIPEAWEGPPPVALARIGCARRRRDRLPIGDKARAAPALNDPRLKPRQRLDIPHPADSHREGPVRAYAWSRPVRSQADRSN